MARSIGCSSDPSLCFSLPLAPEMTPESQTIIPRSTPEITLEKLLSLHIPNEVVLYSAERNPTSASGPSRVADGLSIPLQLREQEHSKPGVSLLDVHRYYPVSEADTNPTAFIGCIAEWRERTCVHSPRSSIDARCRW